MKKIIVSLLATMLASVTHADLVVDFNASNTVTQVDYSDSHDFVSDNTSGNGTIWSAYNENGSFSSSIAGWSAAGLRIRNTTDGGRGTALFGFDLGGSYEFGSGVDDDIFMRISGNTSRIDDAGTGARAAVKHAGTWYVSQELLFTGNNTFDGLALDWFALAGDTSAGITSISGTAVNAATFTDMTMAGAWIEVLGVQDGGGNPNSNYGVQILQLNAVVIPEPSAIGLFGLGALVSILGRRFRRR